MRLSAYLLLAAVVSQDIQTPVGVVITPKQAIAIPQALRSSLPASSVVRLAFPTQLALDGEILLVYETAPASADPDSHIAIVRNERVVRDFRLRDLVKYGDAFTAVAMTQFCPPPDNNMAVIAFRNRGDGAGTAFVIIDFSGNVYRTLFVRRVTQGKIQLRGSKFDLWGALGDGPSTANTCTWCPHHYHVTSFEWRTGQWVQTQKRRTSKTIDPRTVAASPIDLYSAHCGNGHQVFDGEWWLASSADKRSGFVQGAADCLTWVAHEKGFSETPEQVVDRITQYYRNDRNARKVHVLEVWQRHSSHSTTRKEAPNGYDWKKPHWYLNGLWWRQASEDEGLGFLEGYLLCMKTRVIAPQETFSQPVTYYADRINQHVKKHPKSDDESVAAILSRFRDRPSKNSPRN